MCLDISASLREGYVKIVTATLCARETTRERRRVIVCQKIQNNDAMSQKNIMNIHNSSKLNELKPKLSEKIVFLRH